MIWCKGNPENNFFPFINTFKVIICVIVLKSVENYFNLIKEGKNRWNMFVSCLNNPLKRQLPTCLENVKLRQQNLTKQKSTEWTVV